MTPFTADLPTSLNVSEWGQAGGTVRSSPEAISFNPLWPGSREAWSYLWASTYTVCPPYAIAMTGFDNAEQWAIE